MSTTFQLIGDLARVPVLRPIIFCRSIIRGTHSLNGTNCCFACSKLCADRTTQQNRKVPRMAPRLDEKTAPFFSTQFAFSGTGESRETCRGRGRARGGLIWLLPERWARFAKTNCWENLKKNTFFVVICSLGDMPKETHFKSVILRPGDTKEDGERLALPLLPILRKQNTSLHTSIYGHEWLNHKSVR